MPRLILKSPYFKCSSRKDISGYMKYIATRERVEKLKENKYVSKQSLATKAKTTDNPTANLSKSASKTMSKSTQKPERIAPTADTITTETDTSNTPQSDIYMNYIATRPGAEQLGNHGLFGDDDSIDLAESMHELDNYNGKVWTHIISLRREDAARLGFDNAKAWRSLLRAHRNEIAEAMQIPPQNFKWKAAFHNEGDHPHVHMMAWSSAENEGYLNKDGIENIRSNLTNDIFKFEMYELYEQKSQSRDALVQQARQELLRLTRTMTDRTCDHPRAEQLILQLAEELKTYKGKKVYGYLPKHSKQLVNEIVDEMMELPLIEKCFIQWQTLQGQVQEFYTSEAPERKKLSQQKEFRAIKNAVIQQAEQLRLGQIPFESAPTTEQEVEDTRYLSYENFALRNIILDETEPLAERESAVEQLKQPAETGDGDAQFFLAGLYRDGETVIPDSTLAVYWFKQAAIENYDFAQYELGKLLCSDDPLVRDVPQGIAWLEKAAAQKHSDAQYRLGKLFFEGKDVTKNMQRGLDYLNDAATQGNMNAQFALAKLMLTHPKIEEDIALSKEFLRQAMEQEHPHASEVLNRVNEGRNLSATFAIGQLLNSLARTFRDNSLPKTGAPPQRIDKKRMKELAKKKLAAGKKLENTPQDDFQMQY